MLVLNAASTQCLFCSMIGLFFSMIGLFFSIQVVSQDAADACKKNKVAGQDAADAQGGNDAPQRPKEEEDGAEVEAVTSGFSRMFPSSASAANRRLGINFSKVLL